MKKALKITGITLLVILALLIILPIAFKGKIKEVVIAQGNKMLNAEFYFESLNISLIRNFPNTTVTIRGFNLWGIGDFAQDTLVSADRLSATVNLKSLFSDTGYEVTRVEVAGTDIKAIVLADGRPNWDIMKPSDAPADTAAQEASDFRVQLKNLTLKDINIIYDDRAGKMYAALENLGLTLSGDMSAERTTLKLRSEIERVTFRQGGIPYLNRAKIALRTSLDADLANMRFTIGDNSLSLNAITAGIEGMFAMLDNGYEMDLKLNTQEIGFKDILSMIPAIYAKDFKELKASGNVSVSAWAKGKMAGENLPAFEVSVKVSDGNFRYPALPKGVDNIQIGAVAKNPGGSADRTTVDVSPLSLEIAGNPFSATLHLATPLSDPQFDVTVKGVVDLGMVREVYPLEDMELNGTFDANLALKGRLSYIEKEQYDRLTASGTLQVTDMLVQMKAFPDVNIRKSVFTFSPQYLNLSETTVGIGRSDITADCRLENYMAFVLKGETIRGRLNVRSENLDLNEFMGSGEAPDAATPESPQDTAAMKAPKVPANIDFDMQTNLKRVAFDNIVLENVRGQVVIRDSKLDMRNLSFGTLGGNVTANGYYSTAAGIADPELNAAFKMDRLSFGETFRTFETIRKMAPVFEGVKGNFSGDLSISTRLDSMMTPRYATMNGEGGLSTSNVSISGIRALDRIADATKQEGLKNIEVKDLTVIHFTIREGRINTKPFDIKMGGTTLNLSGSTGIDQTIDYTGKMTLPESTGIGKYTTLDLKIGGTFSDPKVSLDTKSMVNQAVKTATSEALEAVGKKLGVDISNAEKQRETLIAEAQKAGERLVAEAQKQADNLTAQAKNRIAQVAAKVAGKKLVEEAQKQADALVAKATAEGDKLVEKTKQEAEMQ